MEVGPIGQTSTEMVKVACGLSYRQLCKSVTTPADSKVWRNFSLAVTAEGTAYMMGPHGSGSPLIQFKVFSC